MRKVSKNVSLYPHQRKAIKEMSNGCILNGGVGTGKSRTSLAYFYKEHGGNLDAVAYTEMTKPRDLYIITTARKRDKKEWDDELRPFFMSQYPEDNIIYPDQKVIVDSWNNIKKYANVTGAFFIFDEQRVVGSGTWVKTFLKIAKRNRWILLSATPGDTWSDYIPVFVANGFYKNKTEFNARHAVYARYCSFPKVERYTETQHLEHLARRVLVDMDYKRITTRHYKDLPMEYDKVLYKKVIKDRWDVFNDVPIENPSSLCYTMRKVVNSHESRGKSVLSLLRNNPRIIVFYNYDYELDILRNLKYPKGTQVREWNGHNHDEIPKCKSWVYLVQYTAGCEGWNCIETNCMVFYSQNYSYKVMEQAAGRIDRLNTEYLNLYYWTFKSMAPIDISIKRAIVNKKTFNERVFAKQL